MQVQERPDGKRRTDHAVVQAWFWHGKNQESLISRHNGDAYMADVIVRVTGQSSSVGDVEWAQVQFEKKGGCTTSIGEVKCPTTYDEWSCSNNTGPQDTPPT
jgi:hypothetical protein